MRLYKDTHHSHTNSFSFFIMSKSVILSLLAQGNTAAEILNILDSIVEGIEQENIDDAAEYFAAL